MIEQQTQEWFESRKDFIGASEAPAIMGVSPWDTPYSLWKKKLGLCDEQKQSFAMRRGLEIEDDAKELFKKITGHSVFADVVYHPTISYIRASLDGITFDGEYLLEIKCVNAIDHQTAVSGEIPEKYYPQLQHQLACCPQATCVYYLSYDIECPENSAIIRVYRDEKYIEDMLKKHEDFWECVKSNTPPSLEPKDYQSLSTREDVEMWKGLIDEYKHIEIEFAELKKRKEELRKKIIESSEGENLEGFGAKIIHFSRPGPVQYDKIPQLEGVDLGKYRNFVNVSQIRIVK